MNRVNCANKTKSVHYPCSVIHGNGLSIHDLASVLAMLHHSWKIVDALRLEFKAVDSLTSQYMIQNLWAGLFAIQFIPEL